MPVSHLSFRSLFVLVVVAQTFPSNSVSNSMFLTHVIFRCISMHLVPPQSTTNRPVFLGNLNHNVISSDVEKIFTEPITDDGAAPVPVDRVDLKRGFCFVFLKDAENQDEKDRAEAYVSRINGMYVPPTIVTTNG